VNLGPYGLFVLKAGPAPEIRPAMTRRLLLLARGGTEQQASPAFAVSAERLPPQFADLANDSPDDNSLADVGANRASADSRFRSCSHDATQRAWPPGWATRRDYPWLMIIGTALVTAFPSTGYRASSGSFAGPSGRTQRGRRDGDRRWFTVAGIWLFGRLSGGGHRARERRQESGRILG